MLLFVEVSSIQGQKSNSYMIFRVLIELFIVITEVEDSFQNAISNEFSPLTSILQ